MAKSISAALTEQGYETVCADSSLGVGGIEVVGSQPGMRVSADVIPSGFALLVGSDAVFYGPGTPVSGEKVEIPSDSVGLHIEASEYPTTRVTGGSCSSMSG